MILVFDISAKLTLLFLIIDCIKTECAGVKALVIFSDGFLISNVINIESSETTTTISTGYVVYSTTIVATALKGLETKLVTAYTFPLNKIGNKKVFIWYPKFITLDIFILIIIITKGIDSGTALVINTNKMQPKTTPTSKTLTTLGASILEAKYFT